MTETARWLGAAAWLGRAQEPAAKMQSVNDVPPLHRPLLPALSADACLLTLPR